MSFTWSWSKLNNFETCGFRHLKIAIQRLFREDDTNPILVEGNVIHDAMAARVLKGTPLPGPMVPFEYWANRVATGAGELIVEQMFSLTKMLLPCPKNSPNVWLRVKVDAARVCGPVGLAIDWKSGKRKEATVQLALAAQCLFSYYPALEIVESKFIWLQSDEEDVERYTRDSIKDIWIGPPHNLLQRVGRMEIAAQQQNYPQTPSGLCKRYCPVSVCPHYQKGTPR